MGAGVCTGDACCGTCNGTTIACYTACAAAGSATSTATSGETFVVHPPGQREAAETGSTTSGSGISNQAGAAASGSEDTNSSHF